MREVRPPNFRETLGKPNADDGVESSIVPYADAYLEGVKDELLAAVWAGHESFGAVVGPVLLEQPAGHFDPALVLAVHWFQRTVACMLRSFQREGKGRRGGVVETLLFTGSCFRYHCTALYFFFLF